MFPKVRYKVSLLSLLVHILLEPLGTMAGISVCNKVPKDQNAEKTEGSNGFSVSLNGSPRLYRPHQTYTISLKGWRDEQLVKFQDFLLVAEPAKGHEMLDANSLGTFQLKPGDAMTKFSHLCSHAIGATSSISKKIVEVYWIAPGRKSGCISFKAMIVERPGIWYMDDGPLTYNVCEDSSALAEPQNVDPCCACDEAKYEIVFEGLWSRHTHPKMFPEDEWRTQFSTLIGASHSSNYSIWDYGEIASSALQVLGEKGITRPLEAQMKHYSHSIRSVIKAHGLQQRSNVEGQTFAVFRVDPTHHLLSVVSKMIPSPDFIVGTSKENLCLPNCSWVAYRALDLYPWDIGTDAGIAYNDPPSPLRPKDIIKRITSNYPNDPKSPFFDESGAPIKPAARLHIVRQRTYKRPHCPREGSSSLPYGSPGGSSNPLNPSWMPDNARDVYSEAGGSQQSNSLNNFYQEDSSSFSKGEDGGNNIISSYEIPGTWNQENPSVISSHGGDSDDHNEPEREGYSSSPEELDPSHPCATTEWEEWSECSSSCNIGSRIRRRKFLDRSAAGMNNCLDENLEKELCPDLPPCFGSSSYGGNFDLFESGNQRKKKWRDSHQEDALDVPEVYSALSHGSSWRESSYLNEQESSYEYPSSQVDCSVSDYGPWSDCSVSCGVGTMTRSRRYLDPERSSSCSQELTEVTHCTSVPCSHSDSSHLPLAARRRGGSGRRRGGTRDSMPPECLTSDWSPWSPCSVPCGLGYKLRTRLYLRPFVRDRSECRESLMEKANCLGRGLECSPFLGGDLESLDLSTNDFSQMEPSSDMDSDICTLPPEAGPCRGTYTRWFFNAHDNKCQKFVFFGCEGNKNNFASEESCLATCHTTSNKDWRGRNWDSQMQLDQPFKPFDCEEGGPWSPWSECSASCERMGWKTRRRHLKSSSVSDYRRECPSVALSQRRRCGGSSLQCLATDHTMWYQGSWRR